MTQTCACSCRRTSWTQRIRDGAQTVCSLNEGTLGRMTQTCACSCKRTSWAQHTRRCMRVCKCRIHITRNEQLCMRERRGPACVVKNLCHAGDARTCTPDSIWVPRACMRTRSTTRTETSVYTRASRQLTQPHWVCKCSMQLHEQAAFHRHARHPYLTQHSPLSQTNPHPTPAQPPTDPYPTLTQSPPNPHPSLTPAPLTLDPSTHHQPPPAATTTTSRHHHRHQG